MKDPIKLFCDKCEEMMPIVLRYKRSGFIRSSDIVADCVQCGHAAREMSILDAVQLGAELADIVKTQPVRRRMAVLVQDTLPGVEKKTDKKKKEVPAWLQAKIRQSYADRARKHKQAQGELF